jgi:hypothetical protein
MLSGPTASRSSATSAAGISGRGRVGHVVAYPGTEEAVQLVVDLARICCQPRDGDKNW